MTAAPVMSGGQERGTGIFGRELAMRFLRSLGLLVISVAVIIGLWLAFLWITGVSSFIAKNPVDVWHYFFGGAVDSTVVTSEQASANRHLIWGNLGVTAWDAVWGYLAGTVIAIVVSIVIVTSRVLERAFMPIAVALRSVPLVAMVPLIALVFGRGLMSVTVIAGIVTFFPTLVNVVVGLRAAPSLSVDVVIAYGGGTSQVLRKVALPAALPSLFASARIAAPAALLGAVIAEWLATGKGLGALMLNSTTTSAYDTLWAAVVVLTVVSILVYGVIALVESAVLARFGQPNSTS